VTAPRFSPAWEAEVLTRDIWRAARDIRETRYIEACLRAPRRGRRRTIDDDALIVAVKANNTPPKTRKLPGWISEGVQRWRRSEDEHIPEVTAPRYSAAWEGQVWTRDIWRAVGDIRENRWIEECLRILRQRTIDKLLREANAAARPSSTNC
jgi:hypothetical protein